MKLINNAVGAANAATLAQALVAADAAGVDLDALVAVMGAARAPRRCGAEGRPMRAHDYTPLFRLAHMLKDVRLCARGERRPPASRSRPPRSPATCSRPSRRGHGDEDFAAVIEAVEGLAGRRLGEG